jgi:hypothetical protein
LASTAGSAELSTSKEKIPTLVVFSLIYHSGRGKIVYHDYNGGAASVATLFHHGQTTIGIWEIPGS